MPDHAPVLVVGGTHGTGRLIARQLHARNRAVRVLARDLHAAARHLGGDIEIVPGDMTRPETLPPAVRGASAVIVTAGVRSGRFSTEARIRATEFEGVRHVIAAASVAGVRRFLYMTSSGVGSRSLATMGLNLYKGNTLLWRARLEPVIRDSGLDYTILRAGFLLNSPGGRRPILVTQEPLPLSIRWRVAREDIADAFVAALDHPRASRATFEVVWAKQGERRGWGELLDHLRPDAAGAQ